METSWWPSSRVWRFVRQLNLNMLCFFASSVFPAMGFGKSSNSFDICSPTRLRVYQHGANVEPHFGTCLSIFFRFSSGNWAALCLSYDFPYSGIPFFEPRRRRKIWSAPRRCSPECEGWLDSLRSDGSPKMPSCDCGTLCGVVLLNLWGHCVDSGLYGYIHIFLYTMFIIFIHIIYIYCIYFLCMFYMFPTISKSWMSTFRYLWVVPFTMIPGQGLWSHTPWSVWKPGCGTPSRFPLGTSTFLVAFPHVNVKTPGYHEQFWDIAITSHGDSTIMW